MTFEALPRPTGITDPALLHLYQQGRERQTGIVGTTLTLSNAPLAGTLDLYKNGTMLDPGDAAVYALEDRTVTLGVASIAGDVWVARYHFRATRTG